MAGATARSAPRLRASSSPPSRPASDRSLPGSPPDCRPSRSRPLWVRLPSSVLNEMTKGPALSCWTFFISWWRWRVTIHYHGKSKIDYLDKTGTAPGLALINISKFIHQFLSQWVSSEYVFSLHKQDIRFHLLLYV